MMRYDFMDLPVGENGLSLETVDAIWESIQGAFERKGRQEFRDEQSDIIDRAKFNLSGTVITDYGKEVAVVLPMKFSKVALALVHLVENARVHAAIAEAKAKPDPKFVPLEKVWAEDLEEEMPAPKRGAALSAGG